MFEDSVWFARMKKKEKSHRNEKKEQEQKKRMKEASRKRKTKSLEDESTRKGQKGLEKGPEMPKKA